ncbi:mRNA cap guanine-N7 methyltransferase [Trichoplax sp. H2]|nr:mRNA cap guanine-N7 methyltransferase [Trichoplax sp. H2]|eukprot:RDD47598.1 mRNA cap guanine-N7 methyltransferase [Trichoplax sp. H2]
MEETETSNATITELIAKSMETISSEEKEEVIGAKRKLSQEDDKDNKELASHVAKHYNELREEGIDARYESRIFFLRNFNNWVKSMLIGDIIERIKKQNLIENKRTIKVLDMACGKGGDIKKWMQGDVSYIVFTDIAGISVEQCRKRYEDTKNSSKTVSRSNPNNSQRYHKRMRADTSSQMTDPNPSSAQQDFFGAEFITADSAQQRLKDLYKDSNIKFDVTSCQFAFHYSFESQEKAELMLQNACECLRPGGYFIGTTPNAYEIVRRARESETGLQFGNSVYNIKFDQEHFMKLFGGKYDFALEGVVDCPEFLVYMPLLKKMAEKYNMELVYCKTFGEVFDEYSLKAENRDLLFRMKALETYPPDPNARRMPRKLMGKELEYLKAKEVYSSEREKLGVLSKDESEATSIYVIFAFQKKIT